MSRIRVGALQPGARPLGIGVSGARRGVADFTDGSRAGVIVKSATSHELAAECFCALYAQDLGMKAPDCAIVDEGGNWLFASVDTGYPNLLQAVAWNPVHPAAAVLLAAVMQRLSQWAGIGQLLAFDVLIQNADRNLGNILLDGADAWLIDHARSMGAFPYPNAQAIFKEMKLCLPPTDVQSVRVKAVSASLTFSNGSHTLSLQELAATQTAPFVPQFDTLIAQRLTSLVGTVNSNL